MSPTFALLPLLLAAATASVEGPRFVQEPPGPRMDFSNTTGAVLPCVVDGGPPLKVQWMTPGGAPAREVAGLRHVRPDGHLVFLPFRAEEFRPDVHDTTYRCAATNPAGTVLSREVKVRGVVQQRYVVDVYDEFVVRGNTAVIRCRVPPSVQEYVTVTSWIRDSSFVIRPSALAGDRFSIFDSGELHVRRVDSSDGNQQYRCETRHRLTGEKVVSATAGRLLVTDTFREAPPRITSSQRLLRGQAGSTLEAPCAAEGFPPPTYAWFRRHVEVLSPLQQFGSRLLQLEGALLIREARPDDSGHYLCKVTNAKGEDSVGTQILVTAPLSARILPSSQSVDVGHSATFNCSATGSPLSSVEWTKDGRTLRPGPGIHFPSRERIRIASVRHQDAGMYQCLVRNEWDSAQAIAQLVLGDYPPKLLEMFREQSLSRGVPLSLLCVAQGRPLPQIVWSLDDGPVPDFGVRHRMGDYVRPGGQVVSYVNVSSAMPEDGGHYSCTAENAAGRTRHTAHIRVDGPPFVRSIANVTAVAGDSLQVACPVGGHPIDSIHWEKEGFRLPLNHRQKVFPNGTLWIRSLDKSTDGGRYSCVAANGDGLTAQSSLFVQVLVRPSIDPFSFPKRLQEGQRYSVLCTVTQGDPPIRIRWTKDDTSSLPDDVRAVAVTQFSVSLVFESLSQEQRGNYTCSAENQAGRENHSATMVIHVPPLWRIEPTDSSAILGKPAVVNCQADGFPVPRIRWTQSKGDGDFRPISSSSRLHVFENGSLVVHSAQPEDDGRYLCQATNGVGQGLSKVVRLSVHVAAHFVSRSRTETARKGDNARIVCKAGGDRPLHITWLKDKLPFDFNADPRYELRERLLDEVSTESVLSFGRALRTDSALYTCIAKNSYGKDNTDIQLIVQEPPDAPQDAKVLELGSRTVRISWTPPYSGNSRLQQYLVLFKEEDEETGVPLPPLNLTVPGSESSVVVSGLSPLTSYQFRVQARNSIGSSDTSNALHVRTEQEAPGAPPLKVKARANGAHTLKVTWKAPHKDHHYGMIEGYYVGYRESISKGAFVYKTTKDGTRGETQLTGLKKLTEYAVLVQAYNAKGAGPPSEQVLAKTLENDPPGSPSVRVIFTNHSFIAIAWEPPDAKNQVQGYVVRHKWDLGEWQETDTSGRDLVIPDLRCGSRYQVHVTAFNEVGRGTPSDVLRIKTDGRAPIAPDKQSLVSTNQTFALVHLGSWLDGECPIRAFTLRYRQQRHQQWVSAAVAGHTVALEDLMPATWYRLQVTAHNEAGSTDAEYTFLTGSLHQISDDPPQSSLDLSLYLEMNLLLPAAVSLAVVVILVAIVCITVHKSSCQSSQSGSSANVRRPESVPLSEQKKSSLRKTLSDPSSAAAFYPTPYATSRVVQKEMAARQTLEEPLYATVKRTPRPPRADFHVYHYPGDDTLDRT